MNTIYNHVKHGMAILANGWNFRHVIFGAAALALAFQGCDSFVETDPPSSQLSGGKVFEDRRTANAAMAGIYTSLRDNGILSGSISGLTYKLGLYADELGYYNNLVTDYCYNNSLFSDEAGVLDIWQQSYKQIYAINSVIEGVGASTALDKTDKDQLNGEAYFLRALIHFYLLNLYGEVPYVSTTDYRVNAVIGKMNREDMLAAIINDLELSTAMLTDLYAEPARIRPNRLAAYALLARVQLYKGNWAEAADAASAVINSPLYSIVQPPELAFLKESGETIWQFIPLGEGNNTSEGQMFIFESGPPPSIALSKELIDGFEPGDLRKASWTKMVSDGSQSWYHAYKYKENSNTGVSKEYSVLFRLAEQYLIRAEARAQQGDIIGAQQDINAIRSRAGLGDVAASDKQALLEAIMRERRIELFTEAGLRFFDLKRTGRLDSELGNAKPGWNSTDALWPLPSVELDANPNLKPQNTGY